MNPSEKKPTWGIDACRFGWVLVQYGFEGWLSLHLIKHLCEWIARLQSNSIALIDIPIGLPEQGRRLCDQLAREWLKQRRNSVFIVPARKAVYADEYPEACEVNRKHQGVAFSKQMWHVCPKVIQVDQIMRSRPLAPATMLECHPELAFWALNNAQPCQYSKHSAEGIEERIHLLRKLNGNIDDLMLNSLKEYPRSQVKPDDLLDACVLAATAYLAQKFTSLPDPAPQDAFGLPMRIVVPDLA